MCERHSLQQVLNMAGSVEQRERDVSQGTRGGLVSVGLSDPLPSLHSVTQQSHPTGWWQSDFPFPTSCLRLLCLPSVYLLVERRKHFSAFPEDYKLVPHFFSTSWLLPTGQISLIKEPFLSHSPKQVPAHFTSTHPPGL